MAQDSGWGSGTGRQKEGGVCVCTDGEGRQGGCGEQEDGCQSFGKLLQGCGMQEEGPHVCLRGCKLSPPHPPAPVASVNKEHSSEGTYVLLFLGD